MGRWMRNYGALITALVLLLLTPVPAAAQTVLPLTREASIHSTAGHLQRLDDPTGTLEAKLADEAAEWTDLPGNLSASYTSSIVWLRLRLSATEPGQWMLLLRNPVLDDVRVYVRQEGGSDAQPNADARPWRTLGASGEDVPRSDWPVDFRSAAFQFDLAGAGTHTVLVRIAGRNAVNTALDVWQRLAFDNHTRREGLNFGLYFGFYLLLICLHTLFWRATRAPASGLFLAYVSLCVAVELFTLGLVQQLTGMTGLWGDRLLGTALAVSYPVVTLMALRQLQLQAVWPRLVRTLCATAWGTALASTALVLTGHEGGGVQLLQALASPTLLLLLGLALWLLRTGYPHARFFLIVFTPYYASALVAFARNMSLFPVTAFTENASAVGSMLHMVLLSLWIVGGYVRQRRVHEHAQIRLESELAQRQHREGELLQALELERRVRQEQRDFVAMVSHEFRTPLAIIGTSAQQWARNLDAPPEKSLARSHNIRAAVQRLLNLVDDCLADDRMAEPHLPVQRTQCDLHALIHGLREDFAPGRVGCLLGEDTRDLATNAALLRIALRNLLANADRHAPAGTAVQISTRRDGDRLHIDVANDGAAIPAEEQARLFERYFRGRSTQGQPGSGLGLYLVQRITEKLGGRVGLVSAGGDVPVRLRVDLPSH